MSWMNGLKPKTLLLSALLGLGGLVGCSGGKSDPSPSTPPTLPSVVTVKPGPTLLHARAGHGAVLLPDGRVGIVGGVEPNANLAPQCEIFDPQTGQFTEAGSLTVPRLRPALLLMEDGRVLVIGGSGPHGNTNLTDLEVWDPIHRNSTWVGALQTAQGGGVSATRLPDGRILVIGGAGFQDPDLLDPTTWTSTILPFQATNKAAGATTCQLPSGDVVLAGGANGLLAFSDRWVYRWSTGIFEPLEPLAVARSGADSVLLKDGRWLVIGGSAGFGNPGVSSIEIYANPAGALQTLTPGATGGVLATATLLSNGRVLLVGGAEVKSDFSNVGMKTTLVYDPSLGKSLSGNPLMDGRWAHTATQLSDGRILVVGGTVGQGSLASTELLTVQ